MLRSLNFDEMGTQTIQYQKNMKYTICLERPTGSCEVGQTNRFASLRLGLPFITIQLMYHAQVNIIGIKIRLESR
jgi:hypothetical protein